MAKRAWDKHHAISPRRSASRARTAHCRSARTSNRPGFQNPSFARRSQHKTRKLRRATAARMPMIAATTIVQNASPSALHPVVAPGWPQPLLSKTFPPQGYTQSLCQDGHNHYCPKRFPEVVVPGWPQPLLSKTFPRRGKTRIAVGETHGRRPPLFPPGPEEVEHPNPHGSTPCGVGRLFQPVPWVSPAEGGRLFSPRP